MFSPHRPKDRDRERDRGLGKKDDNLEDSTPPRRRRKDYDRPRSGDEKAREKDRSRMPIRKVSSASDRIYKTPSPSPPPIRPGRKVAMSNAEARRRSISPRVLGVKPSPRPDESKSSLPYPSFSKAHSRESVRSRENVTFTRHPSTPEPTDLGQARSEKGETIRANNLQAPPSPPLTADESGLRKNSSTGNLRGYPGSRRGSQADDETRTSSDIGNVRRPRFSASHSSLREAEEGRTRQGQLHTPTLSPVRKAGSTNSDVRWKASSPAGSLRAPKPAASHPGSAMFSDSDATSVAPGRRKLGKAATLLPQTELRPPSGSDSQPRTPQPIDSGYSTIPPDSKQTPVIEVLQSFSDSEQASNSVGDDEPPVPPAPPPPPAVAPAEIPKVDYLLQNGGLPRTIPKSLAAVTHPFQSSNSSQPSYLPDVHIAFAPYQVLLDEYSKVMAKNGSIAVATGYRSVARRLLDRLETVFARNISSETCSCIMCRPKDQVSDFQETSGVSWGEVLELVSGRRELPLWPPFSLATSGSGLGIDDLERQAPMQKLDIDVPEEYREHYIRQSKKTKVIVQNWLASQPEEQASPPQEVDDETLTFAMLTYLEPEQRPLLTALMRGLTTLPDSRAPTPLHSVPKTILMPRTALALQRLYRLTKAPREPECSMYLLKNPSLHSVLATLAAISNGEWEVLISGRFDGFLWSGAEESATAPMPPSRGPSRGPNGRSASFSKAGNGSNGFQISRGPTPARWGTPGVPGISPSPAPFPGGLHNPPTPGPVQMDEETEIAALAEVEREIYAGMEALEDAFEVLHTQAETVRRALRERSAGLAVSAQARWGAANGEEIEVRMGTPASFIGWGNSGGTPRFGISGWSGMETDTDDGMGDERSELAPDDSASNIGFKDHRRERKRRPRTRNDRRTPALLEVEEEESKG